MALNEIKLPQAIQLEEKTASDMITKMELFGSDPS